MKYGLFSSFLAKEGKRDELLRMLLEASELLQLNNGCILYVVSTSEDSSTVWVYETWIDKEAHDKSLEPEDIRLLIQKAMPLIESMGTQTELSINGGKGI